MGVNTRDLNQILEIRLLLVSLIGDIVERTWNTTVCILQHESPRCWLLLAWLEMLRIIALEGT